MAQGKQRGATPPDPRRRRLIMIAIGVSVVAASIALAVAIRRDSCDIETRIPEERLLLCQIQQSGSQEDRCDPEVTTISRERCEELIAQLAGDHSGVKPSPTASQ